jgi:hypothetical protein
MSRFADKVGFSHVDDEAMTPKDDQGAATGDAVGPG